MDQIETARIIKDQDGDCHEPISIKCVNDNCPARIEHVKKGFPTCNGLWKSGNISKEQWFTNWLAENDKENVMNDKIQITEEQARKLFRDGCRHKIFGLDADIDRETEDLWIGRIKQAGYIKKSELQQKVEEVEELYNKWLNNEFDGINLIHKQRGVIIFFKKDHPEFKE